MAEIEINDSIDILKPVPHTILETVRESISEMEELTDQELYRIGEEETVSDPEQEEEGEPQEETPTPTPAPGELDQEEEETEEETSPVEE